MLPLSTVLPEYTVTELSLALKRIVETGFSQIRVRGEISGLKKHASGHVYFALKDESSVLDAVCWRGSFGRLAISPSEGMEVIASGRLTTYPGRSKYQIVVEEMEIAGEGALLKLLEERKRKLAAEGLFETSRKKPLPFLPACIGLVTSPTGAVIRDILHRLEDRFPVPVLLWPVAVQGEGAALQVAAAVRGFNALSTPPDLLIIARGGGSLEDLWAFNEETVVRAVAESAIPVISAIGHETDMTLIDFAADKRAPTPTAAAEFAVPVRAQLIESLNQSQARLVARLQSLLSLYEAQLEACKRGMPPLQTWLEDRAQKLDEYYERLILGMKRLLEQQDLFVSYLGKHLQPGILSFCEKASHKFEILGQLLNSYSYTHTLKRGFSFVTTREQALIPSKTKAEGARHLHIHFHDGVVDVEVLGQK